MTCVYLFVKVYIWKTSIIDFIVPNSWYKGHFLWNLRKIRRPENSIFQYFSHIKGYLHFVKSVNRPAIGTFISMSHEKMTPDPLSASHSVLHFIGIPYISHITLNCLAVPYVACRVIMNGQQIRKSSMQIKETKYVHTKGRGDLGQNFSQFYITS